MPSLAESLVCSMVGDLKNRAVGSMDVNTEVCMLLRTPMNENYLTLPAAGEGKGGGVFRTRIG
jgi:hypothetical protein